MEQTGKKKGKLHSEEGASLLFALLFFIVAAMVAAVIVAAAVSGMRRLHDDKEYDQNVLAISSAIMLVEQQLTETVESGSGSKKTTGPANYVTITTVETKSGTTTTAEAGSSGSFYTELNAAMKYFYPGTGASVEKPFYSQTEGYTMHIGLDKSMPTVDVDFIMYPNIYTGDESDKNFRIDMTFSIENADQTETVSFNCYSTVLSTITTKRPATTTIVTRYTWDAYKQQDSD